MAVSATRSKQRRAAPGKPGRRQPQQHIGEERAEKVVEARLLFRRQRVRADAGETLCLLARDYAGRDGRPVCPLAKSRLPADARAAR
jgi:hypothetical protein